MNRIEVVMIRGGGGRDTVCESDSASHFSLYLYMVLDKCIIA